MDHYGVPHGLPIGGPWTHPLVGRYPLGVLSEWSILGYTFYVGAMDTLSIYLLWVHIRGYGDHG